jgi:hypothetical protein
LLCSRPSSFGYVVLLLARSLAAVLPSTSVLWVMSRMSSITYTGVRAA